MRFAAALALSIAVSACDRAPSDLREWKAEDHDRSDETEGRAAPPPRGAPAASSAAQGTPSGGRAPTAVGSTLPANANVAPSGDALATLVDVTWRTQCSVCHGVSGRGDGPQGPMVHAPDLSRGDWQSKVTDDEIAHMIVTGKDKMPRFDFPPDVVAGLTRRVRALRGR